MLKQKVLFILPIFLPLAICSDVRITDSQRALLEADRFAMLYNWPRAATLYLEAEALAKRTGNQRNGVHAKLGYLFVTADSVGNDQHTETIEAMLRLPMIASDDKLKLRALVAKAAFERDRNERDAKNSWQDILTVAQEVGDKSWEARAKAELGQILYMEGDVTAATKMFRDALTSMYLRLDLGAAIYYTAMVGNGAIESGRPETGLQYCSFALRLAAFAKGSGFPFIAHQGKARALLALNRSSEAEAVLKDAITHARQDNNNFALTQLLVVSGGSKASGNPGAAIRELKETTQIARQKGFHHVYAWGAWQLAGVYRNTGALDDARTLASDAIEIMRQIDDRSHFPFHLALLADVEARKGNVQRADELYTEATDVIEALLVNANTREIKASLMDTLSEAYVGHFKLAAESSNPEKAYDIIERARGRSLADTLRGDTEALSPSNPLNLDAQRKINGIQTLLMRETNPAKRDSLLDALFVAEQLLAPVQQRRTDIPNVSVHPAHVPLRTLQESLRVDETLLEYVLAEPQSYCLRISRSSLDVVPLPAGRKRIHDLVENYNSAIRSRQEATVTGADLYSILVKPVSTRASTTRIVVIPDGKLNLLPLDSLRDETGKYVLESHVVTYAPSAAVLYLLRQSNRTTEFAGNFLGVGDVLDSGVGPSKATVSAGSNVVHAFFDITKLPRLAATREEVMSVAGIVGGNNRLLLGATATEAAFKSSQLADYRIIHLAVHGLADAQFPDRAALILGSGGGADGLLQVREIRDLPIRADLVTLSSCDTGSGRLLGEEGIASLERAFLLAGAKSVIASMWTADDSATAALMKYLYVHLVEGQDKAAALRQAKLDFLRVFGDRAIPAFWAGFTLVGDGDSRILQKARN